MKVHVTHHGVSRGDRPSLDALRVEQHPNWLIAVLAEGVGASAAGGEAALRAVSMMADYFHSRPQAWSARRALGEFVQRINETLHLESEQMRGASEMLCTLSVVVIEGGVLYGLNVGDSPVWLWRQGVLRTLSSAQVSTEPGLGHVLMQAIGMTRALDPWAFELALEDGDMVLLASDGLEPALPIDALSALMSRRTPARALVKSVQDTWAEKPELSDDLSAIVIDVEESGRLSSGPVRALEVVKALSPGDRHDGYVLEKPLDEGGRVWHARDAAGGDHVLKFAPPEAAEDDVVRDGFLREVWHASRMEAPEFVHARVPSEGSLRYYVIEFVDAPTLEAVLRSSVLQVEDAIELARFLLRAGQYLLSRDHVHGDIKPANILVQRTPGGIRFRMVDFGSTMALFSTTLRVGTPSYLAPERFEGSPVSERSEIYSIGVTVYQSLTRQLPFGEIERFQTPAFDKPARRPSSRNSAIPTWLDHVLLRALAVDVAERYHSFSEMMYDLDNPAQVVPKALRGKALWVRNPLLFYKIVSAVLAVLVVVLFWKLVHA